MKTKKPKSKINKWKLTAIISLVVNGIVALLLTIGLATPKSYVKTQALDGSFVAYQNSYDINPTDYHISDSRFDSAHFTSRWTQNDDYYISSVFSYRGFPYLENTKYSFIGSFVLRFDSMYDYQVDSVNGVLKAIYFYPVNDNTYFYNVFSASWDNGFTNVSKTYNELGYNSPFCFISADVFDWQIELFNDFFVNLGNNVPYKDYIIRDNWNPNKYISIASDSIGLLYDSPSTASWNPQPQVKWVSPTYYHDYTLPSGRVQRVSTLGFLEIPLLFESNGENFVGIRLYYDVYHHYIDKDGNVKHTSPETSAVGGITTNFYHYGFVYMSYVYSLSSGLGAPLTTWNEKVVSAVPIYQITQDIFTDNIEYREFIYQPFEPYKWLNDEFKVIHTFEYSKPSLNRVGVNDNVSRSRFAINQLTIEQVLEYDMSVSGSPVGSSTYLGDAFALIRDAFASIIPILSLSILPNITIGMLIFIPLVLTIIIVVIKLVKR